MEYFTHWKYKFEVILDTLPYLNNFSDKAVDLMAKTFSIIGVLSGLPQDRRELIFAKEACTFDDFFKDCVSFSPSNDHAHR